VPVALEELYAPMPWLWARVSRRDAAMGKLQLTFEVALIG
jgi:hypothetical protein